MMCKKCNNESEWLNSNSLCDECEKKKQKKSYKSTEEFKRIKKVTHSNGGTRSDESVNLLCERYKLYEEKKWDKDKIISALEKQNKGKKFDDMQLGKDFNNHEKLLPQEAKYTEYYLLSGKAGETNTANQPGTPRLVKSDDGNVYFSSHYGKFISLTDTTGEVIEKR